MCTEYTVIHKLYTCIKYEVQREELTPLCFVINKQTFCPSSINQLD